MQEINIENIDSQMKKGSIEFATLLIISRGEVYASDIIEELIRAELLIVEGTLYPLLSRLRASGILNYRWEESKSGPPRKYYTLSTKGKQTLDELTKSWESLEKAINRLSKKNE